MRKYSYAGWAGLLAAAAFFAGCGTGAPSGQSQGSGAASAGTLNTDTVAVATAPAWQEMLWRDSGWLGADGIYTVALDGVERPGSADSATTTLFWFSDTIIGDIVNDSLQDGWTMLHNSVGYLQGARPDASRIHFYWQQDGDGNAISMFRPATPAAADSDYYWLGDGFVDHARDSTLYIFAYRIRPLPGGIYPFDDVGVSLIAIPKHSRPPYEDQRQLDTPLFLKGAPGGKISFGVAVLPNTEGAQAPAPDGYVYVYGVRGPAKELIVGRVKDTDFENFSAWRFWDGMSWNTDMKRAQALTSRVSNEMSVSFMADGRVMAVFELDTNSPYVAIQVGNTPWGPFHPYKTVYKTPEIFSDVDFYTYNAKAHPHLSKPGTLLISYNVNSFDFLHDIHAHPHHLRPRFISVSY